MDLKLVLICTIFHPVFQTERQNTMIKDAFISDKHAGICERTTFVRTFDSSKLLIDLDTASKGVMIVLLDLREDQYDKQEDRNTSNSLLIDIARKELDSLGCTDSRKERQYYDGLHENCFHTDMPLGDIVSGVFEEGEEYLVMRIDDLYNEKVSLDSIYFHNESQGLGEREVITFDFWSQDYVDASQGQDHVDGSNTSVAAAYLNFYRAILDSEASTDRHEQEHLFNDLESEFNKILDRESACRTQVKRGECSGVNINYDPEESFGSLGNRCTNNRKGVNCNSRLRLPIIKIRYDKPVFFKSPTLGDCFYELSDSNLLTSPGGAKKC